jgi:hypothetical protein
MVHMERSPTVDILHSDGVLSLFFFAVRKILLNSKKKITYTNFLDCSTLILVCFANTALIVLVYCSGKNECM